MVTTDDEKNENDLFDDLGPSDFGGENIKKEKQDTKKTNLDLLETKSRKIDERFRLILDVPVNLSVELGRTKILINDLLQLGPGSVIELDKLAGEAMEIFVNDKLIALGEVVVVNEKFGVRLTDIITDLSHQDYMNQIEEETR